MGSLASKMGTVYKSFVSSKGDSARILMLGLDAAGKTTVLYKIKLNERLIAIPTIGFNVETVEPVKGISFTVWDIGGQDKIRQLWKFYFKDTDALVYVVDSNDISRMEEARDELHAVLGQEEMQGVPLLVLGNKQDLPLALNPSQLIEKLSLQDLKHKWHIHATCANTGEGLYDSMTVLAKMVREFKAGHLR